MSTKSVCNLTIAALAVLLWQSAASAEPLQLLAQRSGDTVKGMVTPRAAELARQPASLGGTEGRPFEQRCPEGEVLVGLTGRSGNVVDQVRIICAPLRPGPGYRLAAQTVRGAAAGGNRGNPGSASCPDNHVMIGFRVGLTAKHGEPKTLVRRIALRCGEVAPPHRQQTVDRSIGPSTTSPVALDGGTCPAGAPLAVGIRGRAGEFINAFGVICGPAQRLAATVISKAPAVKVEPPGGTQLPKGPPAVSGPSVQPGEIKGIVGPKAADAILQSSMFGGTDGEFFERRCPPGEVLVGLQPASAGIDVGVQLVCAPMRPGGEFRLGAASSGPPSRVGGAPGTRRLQCASDAAVTGMVISLRGKDRASGTLIHRLTLQCRGIAPPHRLAAAEGAAGSLITGILSAGSKFTPLTLRFDCQFGRETFAVGVRGRYGPTPSFDNLNSINALGLICAVPPPPAAPVMAKPREKPLVPAPGVKIGSMPGERLQWVPMDFRQSCPPGEYLVGLIGIAGSVWVEQIQILCASLRFDGEWRMGLPQVRAAPAGRLQVAARSFATCRMLHPITGVDDRDILSTQMVRGLFGRQTMEEGTTQIGVIYVLCGNARATNVVIGPGALFPRSEYKDGRLVLRPFGSYCPTEQFGIGIAGRTGVAVGINNQLDPLIAELELLCADLPRTN